MVRLPPLCAPDLDHLSLLIARHTDAGVSEFGALLPINIILNHRRAHVKEIIGKLKKVVDRIFCFLDWYGRLELESMGRAL